jgi:rod shape determining protein RodA
VSESPITTWRLLLARFDRTLAALMMVLIGLGLLNLYSALEGRQPELFGRQLFWLGIGSILFLAAASFDYRQLARAGYWIHAGACGVLAWVLIGGRSAGGAKRWLEIGPLSVQPSELVKVVLIVALAKHIQDAPSVQQRTLKHLLVPVAIAAGPVLLIAAQPDLDNAVTMVLIFLTVMLTARLSLRTWGGIVLAGLVALAPLWEYGLRDYQKSRILTFVNPALNPDGAWQPQQAMNALGSGRLLGKGYLRATQVRARTLPALWTDFPFALWGEEWGFLGGVLMLAAYGALIFWILKVSRDARDRFGAILCIGCAAMLFWQVTFNLAMVTGLGPVAGMTLPLISYGGSSLMTVMIALGLVMNVSMRRFGSGVSLKS